MSAYIVWFVVAAVLVGIELITGTFYLLLYGIAAAAAGLAAWLGAGAVAQLLVAAAIALVGTFVLRQWKRSTAHPESTVQDMDLGQRVEWLADAIRPQARYRGALWDAELAPGANPDAPLYIRAITGNVLTLGN